MEHAGVAGGRSDREKRLTRGTTVKWHDRLADGVLPFIFLLIVLPLAPVAWIIYLLVWVFTRNAAFAGYAYLTCIPYLFVRAYRDQALTGTGFEWFEYFKWFDR